MSIIVTYLIVAITLIIVHNVITGGAKSLELGIMTLIMVLGMTTNPVV